MFTLQGTHSFNVLVLSPLEIPFLSSLPCHSITIHQYRPPLFYLLLNLCYFNQRHHSLLDYLCHFSTGGGWRSRNWIAAGSSIKWWRRGGIISIRSLMIFTEMIYNLLTKFKIHFSPAILKETPLECKKNKWHSGGITWKNICISRFVPWNSDQAPSARFGLVGWWGNENIAGWKWKMNRFSFLAAIIPITARLVVVGVWISPTSAHKSKINSQTRRSGSGKARNSWRIYSDLV